MKHSRSYDRNFCKQVSSHVPLCLTMTHLFRSSLNLGENKLLMERNTCINAPIPNSWHQTSISIKITISNRLDSRQYHSFPTNRFAMSPNAELNQQPQAQEMTADQAAQQVVTSQPVRLTSIPRSAILVCSTLLADADRF